MDNKISKVNTPGAIKEFYQDSDTVDTYEQSRYGNIERSLSHWLDCDAIEYFIKNAFSKNPIRALDLACGTARLTRFLSRQERFIVSLDYAREMLSAAKTKVEENAVPFLGVCSDALSLPFIDCAFDVVFTIRFIRHFKEHDRAKLYKQIHRVLKPGGILIFDVINAAVDRDAAKRTVFDETYTKDQINAELAQYGFTINDMIAGNIVRDPLFIVAKKWSLIKFGLWYSRRIRTASLHLDAATFWIVCAQKKNA